MGSCCSKASNNHSSVHEFCYIDSKSLISFKNNSRITYPLKKKIKVHENSAMGLISSNHLLIVGGTDTSAHKSRNSYLIKLELKKSFEISKLPFSTSHGNLHQYNDWVYFIGALTDSTNNSDKEESADFSRYHVRENYWEVFTCPVNPETSRRMVERNIASSNYFENIDNDLLLKHLIGPGSVLIKSFLYVIGGKFIGKHQGFNKNIFKINLDYDPQSFTLLQILVELPTPVLFPVCCEFEGNILILTGKNTNDQFENFFTEISDLKNTYGKASFNSLPDGIISKTLIFSEKNKIFSFGSNYFELISKSWKKIDLSGYNETLGNLIEEKLEQKDSTSVEALGLKFEGFLEKSSDQQSGSLVDDHKKPEAKEPSIIDSSIVSDDDSNNSRRLQVEIDKMQRSEKSLKSRDSMENNKFPSIPEARKPSSLSSEMSKANPKYGSANLKNDVKEFDIKLKNISSSYNHRPTTSPVKPEIIDSPVAQKIRPKPKEKCDSDEKKENYVKKNGVPVFEIESIAKQGKIENQPSVYSEYQPNYIVKKHKQTIQESELILENQPNKKMLNFRENEKKQDGIIKFELPVQKKNHITESSNSGNSENSVDIIHHSNTDKSSAEESKSVSSFLINSDEIPQRTIKKILSIVCRCLEIECPVESLISKAISESKIKKFAKIQNICFFFDKILPDPLETQVNNLKNVIVSLEEIIENLELNAEKSEAMFQSIEIHNGVVERSSILKFIKEMLEFYIENR